MKKVLWKVIPPKCIIRVIMIKMYKLFILMGKITKVFVE